MNNTKKLLTPTDFKISWDDENYDESFRLNQELQKKEQFLYFLNCPPPKNWIQKDTFASKADYLPIEVVEWLLGQIFGLYVKKEVKQEVRDRFGITVYARIWYKHDVIGDEWMFQDGVGTKKFTTAKNTGVLKADYSNFSESCIETTAGIAYADALKNAAKKIGKIFGADLNRKNSIENVMDEQVMNLPTKPKQRLLEQQSIIPDVVTEDVVYDVPPMPPLYEMSKQNGQTLYNMFCAGKIVDEALVFINDSGFGMNKEIVDWVNSVYNHYLQHNV